jgi:excisionase family DNA binding protein
MFMRKSRKEIPPAELAREKVLEIDAATQGVLAFREPINILINGPFEGTLEALGSLTVGEKAQVRAHLQSERVTILGEMVGDVIATQLLRVAATGRIIGDVRTPNLIVESGGVIQGEVSMIAAVQSSKSPDSRLSLTEDAWDVDQLASYLSVERSMIFEWADSGRLPGIKDDDGWHFDKRKVEEWISSGKIR